MTALQTLIHELAQLDWDDRATAHRAVQELLARVTHPEALIGDYLVRDPSGAEHDASNEKTTHYKYFVAGGPDRRFELWLHDYKPMSHRRVGHAGVPHNHRFWFTSLILRGGFRSQTFLPDAAGSASLCVQQSIELRAGDTFVVDPDEIHALADLQDGTLSLLVQSARVRGYSEVYENGRIVQYGDLATQFAALAARRGELEAFPETGRRHY